MVFSQQDSKYNEGFHVLTTGVSWREWGPLVHMILKNNWLVRQTALPCYDCDPNSVWCLVHAQPCTDVIGKLSVPHFLCNIIKMHSEHLSYTRYNQSWPETFSVCLLNQFVNGDATINSKACTAYPTPLLLLHYCHCNTNCVLNCRSEVVTIQNYTENASSCRAVVLSPSPGVLAFVFTQYLIDQLKQLITQVADIKSNTKISTSNGSSGPKTRVVHPTMKGAYHTRGFFAYHGFTKRGGLW